MFWNRLRVRPWRLIPWPVPVFWFGPGCGFLRCRRRSRVIHPFQNGALRGIALPLVHFDDAGITAVAFLERGRDVFKKNPQHVLVLPPFLAFVLGELHRWTMRVQTRGNQTARLHRAVLAQGDDFFRNGTRGLRLRERRGHALVFEKVSSRAGGEYPSSEEYVEQSSIYCSLFGVAMLHPTVRRALSCPAKDGRRLNCDMINRVRALLFNQMSWLILAERPFFSLHRP